MAQSEQPVLTLRRARRPLAIICLAAVALAVFVPGAAIAEAAPPPSDFILLPQLDPLDTVTADPVGVEQPRAFRSALPERAPPASC
jgi:hypothetical protein